MYCIRSPKRDAVAAALKAANVDTAVYYPATIPGTPAFRAPGSFPNAEAACRDILAIPLYPGLRPEVQERIAGIVRDAVSRA
jgi:dTDP-4-amino-4,6-dideoxygalactose transaminase